MDKINHLSIAKVNYRQCIYSLAARDYDKALGWIDSAIAHINIHIEINLPSNVSELDDKIQEYEKLKRAIERGAGNPVVKPRSGSAAPKGDNAQTRDETKDKSLTFDDVVGLDDAKEAIRSAIVYPFQYREIYRAFKRKSGGGILLYGAPGTGKTMIAKAIAGEIDAEFISVNCSDIYSKWLGESQQNIKRLFDRARQAERAVIFFDEFETLGGSRSSEGGDTSNTINGVVCELLAQIDGFCSDGNSTVLVIAATNRPWDIDSALLRSGRFERHLYVAMPNESARIKIIQKQMSELPIEEIHYDELGSRTEGFSPADITEVCNRVKDRAIMRSIGESGISKITRDDFTKVLSKMRSTVDPAELKRLSCFA